MFGSKNLIQRFSRSITFFLHLNTKHVLVNWSRLKSILLIAIVSVCIQCYFLYCFQIIIISQKCPKYQTTFTTLVQIKNTNLIDLYAIKYFDVKMLLDWLQLSGRCYHAWKRWYRQLSVYKNLITNTFSDRFFSINLFQEFWIAFYFTWIMV